MTQMIVIGFFAFLFIIGLIVMLVSLKKIRDKDHKKLWLKIIFLIIGIALMLPLLIVIVHFSVINIMRLGN